MKKKKKNIITITIISLLILLFFISSSPFLSMVYLLTERGADTSNWSDEAVISIEAGYYPSIFIKDLNIHAVWENSKDSSSDHNVSYRFWNSATSIWSGKVNGTDIISPTDGDSIAPELVVDSKNNIHVVWDQRN